VALAGISWFVIGAMRRRPVLVDSPGTERSIGFVTETQPAASDDPVTMHAAQAT
jgi:hypothetical protein